MNLRPYAVVVLLIVAVAASVVQHGNCSRQCRLLGYVKSQVVPVAVCQCVRADGSFLTPPEP